MNEALGNLDAFGWTMLAVAGVLFALFLYIFNKVPRIGDSRAMTVAFAMLGTWAVLYGGSKSIQGRVTVDDPYIRDAGSYLTNDVCHVAISKKYMWLPGDMEILVYARELSSTNAADWSRLTPHLTYADHPHDYALVNATNYNVLVAANYVPQNLHTNGVWSIRGFVIPGAGGGVFAFPGTRTKLKGFYATNPPIPIFEEEEQ